MLTFWQWLSQLRLLDETYYGLDPEQYDALFDKELEKVITRTSNTAHRQILERMRGFSWMGYIAVAVRHAGFRDQREVQERTHDIAVKLLMGRLFTGFDERVSGPMDLRFRTSVTNAVRNMVEKERNRRRLLPTVAAAADLPARSGTGDDDMEGEKVVRDFRRLVHRRLGDIGLAVLDVRLGGGETKSLVGSPALGSPGKWIVKKVVCQIKMLAKEYARSLGDSEFLRRIEKAMAVEGETVEKRRTATAARQAVGA